MLKSWEDCDDNDPNNTNSNMDDNDCDGVRSWEDLINDPNNIIPTWMITIVIRSWEDCDDNDPNNTYG